MREYSWGEMVRYDVNETEEQVRRKNISRGGCAHLVLLRDRRLSLDIIDAPPEYIASHGIASPLRIGICLDLPNSPADRCHLRDVVYRWVFFVVSFPCASFPCGPLNRFLWIGGYSLVLLHILSTPTPDVPRLL